MIVLGKIDADPGCSERPAVERFRRKKGAAACACAKAAACRGCRMDARIKGFINFHAYADALSPSFIFHYFRPLLLYVSFRFSRDIYVHIGDPVFLICFFKAGQGFL